VTDAVATAEVAGLVMELVEGPTLEDYIRTRGKPLNLTEVRELFIPVLDAIAEAHRRGIIHRDIKPANILLSHEHGRSVPKVTDFGIAKILRALPGAADAIARGQTRADSRMGTLAYMSPEQVFGPKVDAATDRYALGVILFIAVAKRAPFRHDDRVQLVLMHKRQPVPTLGSILPGYPPGHPLDQFFARALAKKPEERYPSAREMILEFQRLLRFQPLGPEPLPATGPAPKVSGQQDSRLDKTPNVLRSTVAMAPIAGPKPSMPPPPPRRTTPRWMRSSASCAA